MGTLGAEQAAMDALAAIHSTVTTPRILIKIITGVIILMAIRSRLETREIDLS
jgi:hypothetical protein